VSRSRSTVSIRINTGVVDLKVPVRNSSKSHYKQKPLRRRSMGGGHANGTHAPTNLHGVTGKDLSTRRGGRSSPKVIIMARNFLLFGRHFRRRSRILAHACVTVDIRMNLTLIHFPILSFCILMGRTTNKSEVRNSLRRYFQVLTKLLENGQSPQSHPSHPHLLFFLSIY
jgi:hypothetical protein